MVWVRVVAVHVQQVVRCQVCFKEHQQDSLMNWIWVLEKIGVEDASRDFVPTNPNCHYMGGWGQWLFLSSH